MRAHSTVQRERRGARTGAPSCTQITSARAFGTRRDILARIGATVSRRCCPHAACMRGRAAAQLCSLRDSNIRLVHAAAAAQGTMTGRGLKSSIYLSFNDVISCCSVSVGERKRASGLQTPPGGSRTGRPCYEWDPLRIYEVNLRSTTSQPTQRARCGLSQRLRSVMRGVMLQCLPGCCHHTRLLLSGSEPTLQRCCTAWDAGAAGRLEKVPAYRRACNHAMPGAHAPTARV